MKNARYFFLFMVTALVACSDDTQPDADDLLLSAIEHNTGDEVWMERYEYNGLGQLISIEDERSIGRRKTFTYNGDQLLETRTFNISNNQLVFRDSMAYDQSGLLAKIYTFSINEGQGLPLSRINHLSYDNQGMLKETSVLYEQGTDYNPRDVYYWSNGNVIRVDHYNGENLLQEFFHTYDNNPAVRIERGSALGEPLVATRNNVISTDWTDYTGLLDTACKPCEAVFTYYSNGLPATYTTNWSYTKRFIYKAKDEPGDQ